MGLYTAPRRIAQDLRRYDPHLRVRWSDGEAQWRIERQVGRANPSRLDTPGAYEDRRAAAEGYVLVLTCDHNQLDQRVLWHLWMNDVQRLGGAEAVAALMEEAEERDRLQARAAFLDRVGVSARDRWAYMNTVRTCPQWDHHTKDLSIVAGNRFT